MTKSEDALACLLTETKLLTNFANTGRRFAISCAGKIFAKPGGG